MMETIYSSISSKRCILGLALCLACFQNDLGPHWNCLAADEPAISRIESAHQEVPAGNKISPAEIPQVLSQLDSTQFEQRQQATQGLAALGSVSLRPLAKSYLDSSPEKRWRIRRILEQLCVDGDEATFFKSAAVMRILYGNDLTVERITELQQDWKRRRTELAAARLRDLGAEVELYSPDENQNSPVFFNLGTTIEPQVAAVSPPPKAAKPIPEKSAEELIVEIDRIMVGSIDQNRRIAMAETAQLEPLTSEQQLAQEFAVPEMEFRNGMVIHDPFQGRIMVNGQMIFPDMPFFGSSVRIGANWRGTVADLQWLAAIQNLTNISLQQQTLDSTTIETLQRISELRALGLVQCEFAEDAIEKLSGLNQIAQLTIERQNIPVPLAETIAGLRELRMLILNKTQWSEGAIEKISDHKLLQSLSLISMTLDKRFFDSTAQLVNLRQLQIQGCKFELNDYREFARKNTTMDIQVTGRSFMGVRAPLNNIPVQFETPSCQISEVVPGSGAEAAGMQAGDEILSINGEPIKAFQELVLLVSQHDPGKTIEVEYRRNQQNFKAQVKLGDRDEAPRF